MIRGFYRGETEFKTINFGDKYSESGSTYDLKWNCSATCSQLTASNVRSVDKPQQNAGPTVISGMSYNRSPFGIPPHRANNSLKRSATHLVRATYSPQMSYSAVSSEQMDDLEQYKKMNVSVVFNLKGERLLKPPNYLKGFIGSFKVVYHVLEKEYQEKFNVQLYRDIVRVNRSFTMVHSRSCETFRVRFEFELLPIYGTDDAHRIEDNFAAGEKKDAVLRIDDKKIHVNKAFLSYHSDFFAKLFNSDFMEKHMDEIPIEGVVYEDFVRMLSLIHPFPVSPHPNNVMNLLKLADRFLIPAVRLQVESFLIMSPDYDSNYKIIIADCFSMSELLDKSVMMLNNKSEIEDLAKTDAYKSFADKTKVLLLDRLRNFVI